MDRSLNKAKHEKQKKRRGWWWKISLALLVLLSIGLTVAILKINSIAHTQVNRLLTRFFSAGGTLEAIDLRLARGRIELDGLKIHPPLGYGTDPLLTVNTLALDVEPTSLLGDEIVIRKLILQDVSLMLVRDPKGRLSLIEVISQAENGAASDPIDASEEQAPPPISSVRVNTIRIENLSIGLIDQLAGEKWSAGLQVDLAVDDLRFRDQRKGGISVGPVDLAMREIKVDQPSGFSHNPLLTVDAIELASPGFSFDAKRFPVSKVRLDHLVASVERNLNGVINLRQLLDLWLPGVSGSAQQQKTEPLPPSTGDKPAARTNPPMFVFEDIQLKSAALKLFDHIDGKPWRAGFEGLDINVTELEVGDLTQRAIKLASFALDLREVTVDQPPGFDVKKLARLKRLAVTSGKLDLASSKIALKEVLIEGLTGSVKVRADGVSNLQKLNGVMRSKVDVTGEVKTQAEIETGMPAPIRVLPAVVFDQIRMEGGRLNYRHEALNEEALVFPLNNIQMVVTHLRLFGDNAAVDPASVTLSFGLGQPEELPTAYFGSVAAMGSLSSGIPLMNAHLRLIGLKLDTLGSLISPATRTALGADGFDAGLAVALNTDTINLHASVLSDKNIQYDALQMQGPLNSPTVITEPILAGAFRHVSKNVLNVGKSGLNAGVGVVGDGAHMVGGVGADALEIGKKLVGNLFKTGAGVARRDQQGMREGLAGSIKDTVGLTLGSAQDTGAAAHGGLKKSFSRLSGNDRLQTWNQGIPVRFQAAMQQAKDALAKMPYPPPQSLSQRP